MLKRQAPGGVDHPPHNTKNLKCTCILMFAPLLSAFQGTPERRQLSGQTTVIDFILPSDEALGTASRHRSSPGKGACASGRWTACKPPWACKYKSPAM